MKILLTIILTAGVVNTSIANMFSKADYESSMETQELMGATVEILQTKGMWMEVECLQPYRAWVPALCIKQMSLEEFGQWTTSPKYIVTAMYGSVLSKANGNGPVICDLVAGDVMKKVMNNGKAVVKGGFAAVELPDGQQGWVLRKALEDKDKWDEDNRNLTAEKKIEKAIEWAEKMMGTPYLWGGMSPKGFDCSGLTRYCYLMAGVKLPRNASQQIKAGKEVQFRKNPDGSFNLLKLKRGDLVFFGNFLHVTHVGLYLGDGRIIHSSHLVRVNSLNGNDENYYENADKLTGVCRIVE